MKINRIDNMYHSETTPCINVRGGFMWMLNNQLHRAGGSPAVRMGQTELYFHRGIRITQKMASGQMTVLEVLSIQNIEQRQVTMEILGYEKFLQKSKIIHKFTPKKWKNSMDTDMYILYEIKTGQDEKEEKIKVLSMVDPSDGTRYFIRVNPRETKADEAIAHSYDYDSFDDFEKDKNWV